MGDTKGLIAWILGAAVFGAGLGAFEGPQAVRICIICIILERE